MATRDTGQSFDGMTRRAFLKTAAIAGVAASCSFDVAFNAEKALAYENSPLYKISTTTCPYCGHRVLHANLARHIRQQHPGEAEREDLEHPLREVVAALRLDVLSR